MNKYRQSVYQDVIEFIQENEGRTIQEKDVDKMPREQVLDYWLEWNGIIGYTWKILEILDLD